MYIKKKNLCKKIKENIKPYKLVCEKIWIKKRGI